MINDELIKKVAEGLFDNAKKNNLIVIYKEDLKFLAATLYKNPKMLDMLSSTLVDFKDKCQALENCFGDIFQAAVLEYIKYLIKEEYIQYFQLIFSEFMKLVNEYQNLLTGTIYSPFKIDTETLKVIQTKFTKKLGKSVYFKVEIDKSILCGIKVILDGFVYELSAKGKLETLQDELVYQIKKKIEGKSNGK